MGTCVFGTDGIRETVGENFLTPEGVTRLGRALGIWITEQHVSTVIIGQDTRLSSDLLHAALLTGLLQFPLKVHSLGVVATPLLEFATHSAKHSVGIMITASHNPYRDNGIKVFCSDTGKITAADEERINFLINHSTYQVSYDFLGTLSHERTTVADYKIKLNSLFLGDFLNGITLVVDCANGAYAESAPELLASFGATVISLHTTPDGRNINENCGAIHTESLQQKVIECNATLGCAFDGDGDRLIVVTREGKKLDGDDTLALLLQHPLYHSQNEIVGTIMSNEGLAYHLKQKGKGFIRTAVGDKYVAQVLKERKLLIGGEPSGHTILRDFSDSSDGLFAALRVLESIIINKNWELTTFKKFPQVTINMPVKSKQDLHQAPYASIIKENEEKLPCGRIIVRYSGTEPLLRITVEDQDATHAQEISIILSETLARYL